MNGVNIAEACHTVLALPPQSIANGATSLAWSMKQADHVSIIIAFGTEGGSPPTQEITSIQVNACTSAAGANATPIGVSGGVAGQGFRYYYQLLGGAGNDILNGAQQKLANSVNPPNYTSGAAGIVAFPTSMTNLVWIIEIDSAEVEILADVVGTITEYPYLQVVIGNGSNAAICTVLAILSGLRYAFNIGATQTV